MAQEVPSGSVFLLYIDGDACLNFAANGGKFNNPDSFGNIDYGCSSASNEDMLNQLFELPYYAGHRFLGWIADGEEGEMFSHEISIEEMKMAFPSESYTAVWEESPEVTFTLHSNGGTFSDSTTEKTFSVTNQSGSTISSVVGEPTWNGYRFKGWSTIQGGAVEYDSSYVVPSDFAVTDLYAVWENLIGQISLNSDVVREGTADATATEDDIRNGKIAYAKGEKKVGTKDIPAYTMEYGTYLTASSFQARNVYTTNKKRKSFKIFGFSNGLYSGYAYAQAGVGNFFAGLIGDSVGNVSVKPSGDIDLTYGSKITRYENFFKVSNMICGTTSLINGKFGNTTNSFGGIGFHYCLIDED